MRRANGWHFLAVALCALALAGPATAHDEKATDKQVFDVLREVINKGADLYNAGDYGGCYRLYEGALIAIKPVLSHRGNLQKAIDAGIATRSASIAQRAHDLRKVIDQIRDDVNPNPKPLPMPTALWDKYKEAGFKKVIADFVTAASADKKVDFDRGGKFKIDRPKLEKLLLDQFSSLTGGPYEYKGRSMKETHKGMGITEEQFNAAAGHLQKSLMDNGVTKEDTAAIMAKVATTKADIVETKKPDDPPKPVTLWDKYKEAGFKKVIGDFVKAAKADDKVDFTRKGKFPLDAAGTAKVEKLLLEQFSELTGGPYKYTGRSMKETHKGMMITEAEFNAAAGHLQKALMDNGVTKEDTAAIMTKVAATKADIVEK